MVLAPVPFCICLLAILFIGLAGNLRFFAANWNNKYLHKRLLLLMTALHIPLCIMHIADILRIFLGIHLTRSSCLRFIGSLSATFSLAQSLLHSLIGIELIVLITNPLLFRKLRVRWFTVPVCCSFFLSAYSVHESWISDKDYPVPICIPATALSKAILKIRYTIMFSDSITVLVLYAIIIIILMIKKSKGHDASTNRVITSSFILAVVFLFSWFATIAIDKFSMELSLCFGVSQTTVLMSASVPAMASFGQTHYVYFFVSAKNRQAFRQHGPISLFLSKSTIAESKNSITIVKPAKSLLPGGNK